MRPVWCGRKGGIKMAERQSEQMRRLQDKIKLLQGDLELSQGISDELEKRVQEMSERAEDSFLNSPTYRQMRMKMEFLEASMKRKEEHLKAMEGLRFRTADAARRLIEDGQGPTGAAGNALGSAGTEPGTRGAENPGNGINLAEELARAREEAADLEGRLAAADMLLAERDGEIERLRETVAGLEARLREEPGKTSGKARRVEAVTGRAR